MWYAVGGEGGELVGKSNTLFKPVGVIPIRLRWLFEGEEVRRLSFSFSFSGRDGPGGGKGSLPA